MNTDSFKQRQQIFQGGGNQTSAQPKSKLSGNHLNKEILEPKSKNSNSNINSKKNIIEENNISHKKINIISNNPILKNANQMEDKKKKNDSNNPKDNLSNIEKNKNLIKNENENNSTKKECEIKEKIKEIEKKEKEKEKGKENNINEEKKNKIEEIKKQIEKGNINKIDDNKMKNCQKINKKEEKIDEIKRDKKINEITKKFEKEVKKEAKIDYKKTNTDHKDENISIKKDSSNKEFKNENKINEMIKNLNKNKAKDEEKEKENNNVKNISSKNSPSINTTKYKEFFGSSININQERNMEQKKFKDIYETLYSEAGQSEDKKTNSNNKRKVIPLSDLDVDNFKDFNEQDYSNRKYDKYTIDKGKIFFKYRYLKNKYTQINETIRRLSTVNRDYNQNDLRYSSVNTTKLNFNINNKANKQSRHSINIDNKFKLSNNIHLSFFIQNPSAQCLNSIDKDSELRHYHSQFLQLTEKSILCFNLKKYEESYLYLFSNNIINNIEEFGEFLLVVNGFDKFIIGEFISSSHKPNDKKEVLKSFINSIKMDFDDISFLECFRFFMTRLYLPKDANLILEIMNSFSEIYFENSKHNDEFLKIYKSPNNIYLLISTLLAVNTMFTRKDIKNINIIKKEEFVAMNKDVQENIVISLYDELSKKPFLIENDNYNENIYRRMSTLVKDKISSKKKSNNSLVKSKTFNSKEISNLNILENNQNFIINEEDSDEENDSNFQNDINTKSLEKKDNSNFGQGNRPVTRSSFSLTKNLYCFTEQDKEILSKIQKFKKFIKIGIHEREFLIYENFTKLIWGKNVEQNKDKGNLHSLLITDIVDVFNGIEHSDIIKKYIKANPKESKDKNNYITIISNKRQINLKCESLQTALLWYKALKSLALKTKNENLLKNSKTLNEINTQFKMQLEELWKEFILPKWNIYGNYILMKLKQKNKTQDKKEVNSSKNIDAIIKDAENDKILEFYDFLEFFYLGLPSFCRGTIWRLLIGNACYITETLYENFLLKVEPEDFNTFDKKYHEDINTILNREYYINQMITDIIKTKDLFLLDLKNLKIDQNQIMIECYYVLRIFFLMRSDLVYKYSIVPLIFVFLMIDENEYNAFCNVYNLICNSDIIKFYIGDEDFINKYIVLFNGFVKKYLPKIHEHFTNLEIEHELYFIPWITEIFSSSMSYKLLLRVLDLYLINGEYILFQIGLSILAIQEDNLIDLAINEIFKLLKRLSSKYKEDLFLEKMKSFDCIKEDYNNWKNENELGSQKLQLFQAIFNDDK